MKVIRNSRAEAAPFASSQIGKSMDERNIFVNSIVLASILSIVLVLGFSERTFAKSKDTTPPVISANVSGTMGNNGWYTSDVTLTWNVSDSETEHLRTSGCETVEITTDTAGATYTCSAKSRGGESTKSVTIKRDATLPSVTITTPEDGATYNLNQIVQASYSCQDDTSKVATCIGTVANGAEIDTASGGSKSYQVAVEDNAGNSVGKTIRYTVTAGDSTPPVVTPNVTGSMGQNGWYTSNVLISWTVIDPETPVSSTSGCDSVTVNNNTAGTTFTCTATSSGGTTSKSVTVKRDATPPSISISTPQSGATYDQNQTITANYSCSDTISGMSSCSGTVANGATITLNTSGSKNFTVNATDQAGNSAISSISYTVSGIPVSTVSGTHLFAWNDLGMHCADSDFSVFTLLPPFNDLNAQLVVNGKLVSTGYSLTYEATPDPTGSINTYSEGKTNFWDYDLPLFGVDLAPNVGLTGNPTPSGNPEPMEWSGDFNWFEVSGIPITPIDDNQADNYFPLVRVTAYDSAGQAVATTDTVLPVSSEINCGICHASNTGNSAAKPAAGWVNQSPGSETDWRLNVLRLHDEKNSGNSDYATLLTKKGYGNKLETSAINGTPVLCDTCHNSNALAVWGIGGEPGISNMTAAMHNRHAYVSLPGSNQTLNSIPTRDSCYNCHPGQKTQCLRGAMGNPVDTAGNHTMECQSCHGSMVTVGNRAREGWFDMPTCQSCHHDGKRETIAINNDGTFKNWSDIRFASKPDTPSAGWSLYRFSTGHGNLQCEACHNSTHAEYTDKPSANGNQVNDNLRAIAAQGYAAAIRECTVCHQTMPSTTNGGPHGMHNLGQSWVTEHHDAFNSTPKSTCYYCHGTTSSGSPLAVIKITKTFRVGDSRTKTFAPDERVTCWSCHNGPNP